MLRLDNRGGIVLEAALVLPLFLALVLALNSMFVVASAQSALHEAVTGTVMQVSSHWYPAEVLVQEIGNQPAIKAALDKAKAARNQVTAAEDFVQQYADYLPDAVVELMLSEQELRQSLESQGQEVLQSALNQAATPVIRYLAGQISGTKAGQRMVVTNVEMPDLFFHTQNEFVLEAELEVKLPIPFFSKTVILKERAAERVWIGE
ncbi:TadE/TadG family type IV pilus assembly protein [Paenibacillus sp. y28]|uniref:TadE/TadG family type IV pilus assembly protein n=1 Tax=Paenibacillus sp. y28 TaxID=3129110 RepID=UPI0030193BD0